MYQHYVTLPLNKVLEQNSLPANMSMELDQDVLSQGFGEQISNLILGADGENFILP